MNSHRSGRAFLLAASGALLMFVPAVAQTAPDDAGERNATPSLSAAPLDGDIVLDGSFDEPAWSTAEIATDFTQSYPDPGAPPSQRTEVRILAGEEALYVAARMYDTAPDSIAAQLARRDASGIYSDWFHVMIDSRHDRRTAFRFSINPRGVQKDVYTFDDGNEDVGWDAVWESVTRIDTLGWTAEMRIPYSQLRFARARGERVWGLGIMRDIARHEERATWSPWTQNDPGFVSRFGTLTGLEGIEPGRRIELLPYSRARLTRAPGDAANPFYESNETGAAVGVDLKAGLPRGLTLSASINPDFGQVEVDPAVVNLSAFETFFPERRPFFVEGADVFRFGEVGSFNNYNFEEYFYSRRVGRSPQRAVGGPGVRYVDAPNETTILGAAKVTGRSGPWTIGVMDAVTAEEEARYVTAADEHLTTPVEPLTNYFVGRLRRDLRDGNTIIGGMVTATHRQEDPAFAGLLRSRAYFGGVDFEHTWADRAWMISGYLAGSRVEGDPDAVAATQRSSARYFGRPDADYVDYVPTRTTIDGHMAEIAIRHAGSWDLSLDYKESSPGFEINDLGFMGRTDYRAVTTFLGRRVNEPGPLFRSHSYYGYTYHAWNFGGDQILDGYAVGANGTFNNLWFAGTTLTYRPAYLDDRLTRGGPISQTPSQWQIYLDGGSDSRKRISAFANLEYIRNEADESTLFTSMSADIRPGSSILISLGPSLEVDRGTQYVSTFADPVARTTYNGRYVFADLHQTTLALETRLDWTFSPKLSLQLYAQPFVSAGDYSNFKELLEPGTYQFGVYGEDRGTFCQYGSDYVVSPMASVDCPASLPPEGDRNFNLRFANPDFNFRSLRGNAVLRWEYRPGSAIFLVWQQQRSGAEPLGDFDLGRDAGAIFDQPATDVFLIKATYWIGF